MQIVVVDSVEKGLEKAKEELYKRVDNKTVLFLSGGSTPKPLYERLAKEAVIKPSVVAMVDERFGKKLHENSNEKMIQESGFTTYLAKHKIPFYPILHSGLTREQTAIAYDKKARDLFFHFNKSVGILGIGADGHTAGIAPNREDFKNPIFDVSRKHLFVSEFDDKNGNFGERITLSFAGLSLLDFFIVLAFGKEKESALQKLSTSGPLEEIPARFYNSQDIAKKTLFITDQKI